RRHRPRLPRLGGAGCPGVHARPDPGGHLEDSVGAGSDWLRWAWRPDVSLVLVLFGLAYLRGWRGLRRQAGKRLAARWQLAADPAGPAAIAVALMSPIDVVADRLFTAHMVQHQLLLMVAPPLLLLANPFPFVVWGLPRRLRRRLRPHLVDGTPARRVLRALTRLPVAGL